MPKSKDRIVIDTNLWISFLLSREYIKLDKLFSDDMIIFVFNRELIEEFVLVARRPKFRKYFSISDLNSLLDEIHQKAEFFEIKTEVIVCRDPKDNFLLSLSQDSNATHLITGDKDLLKIKKYKKTKIVTITQYLKKK